MAVLFGTASLKKERKKKMKKALFIYNPAAGRQQLKLEIWNILSILNRKYQLTIRETTKEDGAKEIIEENKKEKYDVIICCGGDGTLNDVVGNILKHNMCVPIGYIPCGSTNDFARSVGIPLVPTKAVKEIIKEDRKLLDIGMFESENEKRTFSYIASFGVFTDVSYSTPQKIKNALGHTAYILGGVQPFFSLFNAPVYKTKIKTKEKEIEGEYIFGAISNSKSVAGIVKLKENVKLDDGMFEGIFIKKPKNAIQLNELFATIASGKLQESPLIDFIKGNEFEIETENLYWSLDGEKVNGKGIVKIKNKNKAISFCC